MKEEKKHTKPKREKILQLALEATYTTILSYHQNNVHEKCQHTQNAKSRASVMLPHCIRWLGVRYG